MIAEYPALKELKRKVIVDYAAAPMKAAIPLLTLAGCSSLLCGDHLLNTALSKSINKIEPLKEVIDIATKLSNKVIKSSVVRQLIEKECKGIRCDYVKIIAPVVTRWNSNYIMLESIQMMKSALIQIREKEN